MNIHDAQICKSRGKGLDWHFEIANLLDALLDLPLAALIRELPTEDQMG